MKRFYGVEAAVIIDCGSICHSFTYFSAEKFVKWGKLMIAMRVLIFGVLLLIAACSEEHKNQAPVLVRTLSGITVQANSSLLISFEYIEAYDEDGDELSLVLSGGENYSIEGLRITPTSGFIGTLTIPVAVTDGELLSRTVTITLSVVESIELLPLETGSWWEYIDSAAGSDSSLISRMEVGNSSDTVINGENITIYDVVWSDIYEEYGAVYRLSNSSSGTILHSAYSPTDTIDASVHIYPANLTLGDSWVYRELRYDASDEEFFLDSSSLMICTDTSVFITVPAGTFECVEFSVKTLVSSRAGSSSFPLPHWDEYHPALRAGVVTEKLYYAGGLGYILNTIEQDGELLWKKALNRYSVKIGE